MSPKKHRKNLLFDLGKIKFPENVWSDGGYEIGIKFESITYKELYELTKKVWEHPKTIGPLKYGAIRPIEADKYEISDIDSKWSNSIGIISLPNGKPCPCKTILIPRVDPAYATEEYNKIGEYSELKNFIYPFECVFYLYIPIPGIGLSYPVGAFPFDDGCTHEWRIEVDQLLCEIAKSLYSVKTFKLAIMGDEADFDRYYKDPKHLNGIISERRDHSLLMVHQGKFQYYPTTEGAPFWFEKKTIR